MARQTASTGSFHWSTRSSINKDLRRKGLPVVEETSIPLGESATPVDARFVSSGNTGVLTSTHYGKATGCTILRPGNLAFVFPCRWAGSLSLNGTPIDSQNMHLIAEAGSVYFRGGARTITGVTMPRETLYQHVAALRGIDPEDVESMRDREIALTPDMVYHAHRKLSTLLSFDSDQPLAGHFLHKQIAAFMSEFLERAAPAAGPDKTARVRNPARLVAKAERCFLEAQGDPVSLAELCQASGVGRSSLNIAFHKVCGVSPVAYFHRRRLMMARRLLSREQPRRGAVKRAALDAGLTELGRFSVQYRQMFHESPSETLMRSTGSQT